MKNKKKIGLAHTKVDTSSERRECISFLAAVGKRTEQCSGRNISYLSAELLG